MSNSFTNFFALCSLKNKINFNALRSKANSGKAFGLIMMAICTIWAISDFSSDASEKLILMPYGSDIIKLLFSFIVLCLCFITFTGDLSLGHSIGTGQLSRDFVFLRSLPIKPMCLIASKLYERFISDYFGFLVMLSFFIGISCRKGFSLIGVIVAIVLYLQLSLLIGLCINVLMIVLSHFCKKTTTENIFSAIGYISAFSILLPFLAFNSQPQQTLNKIAEIIQSFGNIPDIIFAPFVWVAECLIQSNFCFEFIKFTCLWVIFMTLGSATYAWAVNKNWFNQRVSTLALSNKKSKSSWLKGIFGKEIRLLKSDFNMLLNAIFMPITVIFAEIYLMKNSFSFTSITTIQSVIYASIVYFCMFGPINCIGSEGKAISFIETLPMAPKDLIIKKWLIWSILAEIIFLPTSFAAVYYLNFPTFVVLKSTALVFFFILSCIFGAVCISAICANYEAKSFPQRSSIIGKCAAMALLCVLAPVKSLTIPATLDKLSFIAFLALLALTWKKSCLCLKYRLDTEVLETKSRTVNYLLLSVSYLASTVTILQFFEAIIPGVDTEHWAYTFPLIFILPITAIYFFSNKRK